MLVRSKYFAAGTRPSAGLPTTPSTVHSTSNSRKRPLSAHASEGGDLSVSSDTRPSRRPVGALRMQLSTDDGGPYIATAGGGFRERYASVSQAAFEQRRPCDQHEEVPLRCLLVGHNPSDHAWASGAFYSNPTNRFWPLLRESGIIPADWRPSAAALELCNNMGGDLGIGITDILLQPGSDAQTFKRNKMITARDEFYSRLERHVRRAGAAPRIIAFVGKRQWAQCFEPPLKSVASGPQEHLPPGWPFTSREDDGGEGTLAKNGARAEVVPVVWVLTSPSGRAAIPAQVRLREYRQLGLAVQEIPWEAASDREADESAPAATSGP